MNERELLEKAARACGFEYECISHTGDPVHDQYQIRSRGGDMVDWNPLTNSGDCVEMNAELQITTTWVGDYVLAESFEADEETGLALFMEEAKHTGDVSSRVAAWRYASTVVAGMIGERK